MDRTERFYRIKKLLQELDVVPRQRFLEELEISLATLKRDFAFMRERLHAPIEYDVDQGGYRLVKAVIGPSHEMPGLWFNADEIHALLTMQQLLQQLQPGLLTPHIEPLQHRLRQLLSNPVASEIDMQKRIRIHRVNARHVRPKAFDPVSTALLERRQLTIEYFNRGRNCAETRTVSPQRLVYYRDNWYLDAWCHMRGDLRSFSLDAIARADLLDAAAVDIAESELDAVFDRGYGIFSGRDVEWAILSFAPERARWVSRETWHPRQQAQFAADGRYVLRVPYSDDRELVMDILRHMPEVAVLGPPTLRARIAEMLRRSLASIDCSAP